MVTVHCITFLDEYRFEKWPSRFACRPEIGDRVASTNGKTLKIVSITHNVNKYVTDPILTIELGK